MRDFIYGKSDVLVAILIIAIAGTVIFTRVNAIMEYPVIQAQAAADEEAKSQKDSEDPPTDTAADEGTGDADAEGAAASDTAGEATAAADAGAGKDTPAATETKPQSEKPAVGTNVSFTVASGEATSVIAGNLVTAGLVSDKQAFLSAVQAKSAETKLRAGTFTIPAGSTPEQIVDILTK